MIPHKSKTDDFDGAIILGNVIGRLDCDKRDDLESEVTSWGTSSLSLCVGQSALANAAKRGKHQRARY